MDAAKEYASRIRDVFDLFDSDKRGFITVERFAEVAREHFGAGNTDDGNNPESISKLIKFLDPEEKGEIHFPQFCEGVKQILEQKADKLENAVHNVACSSALFNCSKLSLNCNQADQLLASDVLQQGTDDHLGSVSCVLTNPINQSCHLLPFDDIDSGVSCNSDDVNRRMNHKAISDHDGGDCMSDDGLTTSEPIWLPSTSSRASHSVHSSPVSIRRATPSAVASHLYHTGSAMHNASGRSSASNIMLEDIDGNFSELNDKVKQLEDQIQLLTENQRQSEERQMKIKEENLLMIDRVHMLEEQLREMELRSLEQLVEEQRKSRELLTRLEKEKSAEIELLMQSYNHIEKDYATLKEDMPGLRSENERLYRESGRQVSQIDELNQQLSDLMAECDEMRQRSREEQFSRLKERDVHAQLVEELGKELDELRALKAQSVNNPVTDMESDMLSSHCRELEELVISLKQENARLRDQIDDLQAQLLHLHVGERQLLLQSPSAEFDSTLENLSRNDMMDLLRKEQESNQILRNYVEQITLRILENNPSILEVASRSK